MRPIIFVMALLTCGWNIGVAQAKECPYWGTIGAFLGVGKSCGFIKGSIEEIRAVIPVMAKDGEWECTASDLSNMQGEISNGANYDRYDNHYQICSSLDEYRPSYKKIDNLIDAMSGK